MVRTVPAVGFISLLMIAVLSLLAALTFGAVDISLVQVVSALFEQSSPLIEQIVWQLRLPRTILAFVTGGGLALAGLMLQTVTRNPLADPYLFGVSSGAAVGVVLVLAFAANGVMAVPSLSLSLAAFIGSLVAIALLLIISGSALGRQVESMLLAGVALSFLFSAITSITLYFSDPQAISAVLFWTMGSFSRAQWSQLTLPALLLVGALVIILLQRRQLTALLLGDESAVTLGVNVKRFRLTMLLLSSLLTASLVSVTGGIGFVGLMIPHMVRLLVSQANMLQPLLVCLAGGIFMIWVDVLARTLLEHQELPVGVITGLCGSLFFIVLMYFRQHKSMT